MRSPSRGFWVSALLLSGATSVEGQSGKPVLLQLRPRIGDTISMRLDQQMEMSGKRDGVRTGNAMMSTIVTYSRAIVESGVASATTIVAVTDSILTYSGDPVVKGPAPAAQRSATGQRMRFNIAPDGSLGMPESAQRGAVARTASLIPATFPTAPVSVGEKWSREAALPAGTSQLGATIVGWVKATFRLDSLTRNGELAWVSMRGTLHPDPQGSKMDGVATLDGGTVDGYMVIDRIRGWLSESRFNILAHSTLRQAFGMTGQPMSFEIKLTQALRTIERR